MPGLEENLNAWDKSYEWTKAGNEWSAAWGGADAQWFGSILPRIHSFVPARTILEIAPGHGRWTNYLRQLCKQLIVVDLAPNCIKVCEERFASDSHLRFYVNDGGTLPMESTKKHKLISRHIAHGVPTPDDVAKPPNGVFRLVYTGRLEEKQKCISEVTRALCSVVNQNPGVEAWIVGEGSARANVERIIETSEVDTQR